MKKIIYILTTIAVSATLMMGCGSNTTSTANNDNTETSQSGSNDNGSNKHGNFQKADLEGEVTSINGNKITLKLIKTPSNPSDGGEKPTDNNGGQPSDNKDQPANNKGQNSTNKDNKGSNPPQRQIEYTGETKEITIGDSVKITAMSRGNQSSESQTLSTSDIKVGNVLQITYSDKSSETISSINVMQNREGNNTTNGNTSATNK